MAKKKQLQFIDLFAGLGGFHLALSKLGCKCVFSSELKEDLRKLYQINYPGVRIEGDITKIAPKEIPAHDIICAGFPCQPFSQAGNRQGFNDEKGRGTLFDYIIDIVAYHRPKYIILENVSNLKGHDNGNTWRVIQEKLDEQEYSVKAEILSPHEFGIPQHRKRIYIVCIRKDLGLLDNFTFPKGNKPVCDVNDIIDPNTKDITPIKEETHYQLNIWQEFIDKTIANGGTIPTFPIWAMEFGASYDFETVAPAFQSVEQLVGKKGKLGQIIRGTTLKECLAQLPNYSQTDKTRVFPVWKIRYIQQNRDFYNKHKSWLKGWVKKVVHFENSHLKMEWNCGVNVEPRIENKIVQFRASGIRVKRPTFVPALNLVGTQIPIFPWIELPENMQKPEIGLTKGRYMTLHEAASVQGMRELSFGNDDFRLSLARSYEALGNAVNVELVKMITKKLLDYAK